MKDTQVLRTKVSLTIPYKPLQYEQIFSKEKKLIGGKS